MVLKKKFVAIITSSPALSSIISMVLDCEEHLHVLTFNRADSLKCHSRIAPVDLIIADYQIGLTHAPQLAVDLRQANPNRHFQFIVLADFMDQSSKQACQFAAIDEVIAKPMSPLFVRDRVLAQLDKAQDIPAFKRADHVPPPISGDNVVSLYAKAPHPINQRCNDF